MGFFKKARLVLSGVDGQIEANIINAFDYLEMIIDKKKLVKFHKRNYVPLFSFAYNIAADVWLKAYPDPHQSNKKVILLTLDILNKLGFETEVPDFTDPKVKEDIEDKDLGLGFEGHWYMYHVFEEDKNKYLDAIDTAADIINNNT